MASLCPPTAAFSTLRISSWRSMAHPGHRRRVTMRSRGRSRLLPHLPSDNTFSGPRIDDAPGIDLFAFLFVAVVDAIPLDDRSVAIYLLVNDTRCAVRRPGDGEPLTGLRILDRVTLLALGERHLLCCMFRTHCPPRSSRRSAQSRDHLRILPPTAPVNPSFTAPLPANFRSASL